MIRTDGRPTIANAPALPPELDPETLEAEFAQLCDAIPELADTLVSDDTALD